tara:strand:+ start:7682 stop:8431 length:750 start_codon:yes stop_codon:yes gene_type:complete
MATSILKNPILKKYLVEAGIGGMLGGAAGAAIATKNEESGEGRVAATLTGLAAGAALPFAAGQAIRAIRFGTGFPKKVKADVRYNAFADNIKAIESKRTIVNEQLKNFNYSQALERAHADRVADYAKKEGIGIAVSLRSSKDTEKAMKEVSTRIDSLKKARKDPSLFPEYRKYDELEGAISKSYDRRGAFSSILRGAQGSARKQHDALKSQRSAMEDSLKKVREEQREYVEKMRKQFHTDIYGKWLGVF